MKAFEFALTIVILFLLVPAFFAGPGMRAAAADTKPEPGAYEQVSFERALEKGCLSCHEGIEDINPLMTAQNVTCINCHYGNPVGVTKDEAHAGMIADPGDLRYIEKTCGQCHSAKPRFPVEPFEVRGEKGHVDRMLKGVIATAAGEISGTRFVMGAQDTPAALYGVRVVADEDGTVPTEQGARSALKPLPAASTSDADNLLRHSCLQCHIWTEGRKEPGYYRGTGCTACHVLYNDDGLSKTGDPTISRTDPGHPARHEIIVDIPTSQCLRCHDSGPGRYIGPQFVGKVPRTADFQGTRPEDCLSYAGDVHYQRGMDCIDCHSSSTIHGDGNIYSKAIEQVAVRCETCHGTLDNYATLTDERGEQPYQLSRRGQDVFLTTKITQTIKRIPQVKQLARSAALPAAMQLPAHMQELENRNRLECYACHAQTVTQCYGCHTRRDDRRSASMDWIDAEEVREKELVGIWEGTAQHIRWNEAPLGINSRGRVSPFIPGGQTLFTRIAPEGTVVALDKTPSKQQPFSFNPVQPHSTTKRARTCESCHNNPAVLGLGQDGQGIQSSAVTGPGIRVIPFERFVDEQGNRLQSIAHADARPFSAEEMDRINRINVCVACHKRMPSAETWKPVTDEYGRAITTREHKNMMERLFQQGTVQE